MKTSTLAFAAVLGSTATSGFSQPGEPLSPDVWALLDQIQIEEIVTETSYEVRKSWPDAFAQDLSNMRVTGYAVAMIPGAPGQKVQELLLTSDSGICPLCGSGDHAATLQIVLDEPLEDFVEGQRISVEGTLMRVDDSTTWQSAQMINARLVDL